MDTPKVAGTGPIAVDLEEGKQYAFCSCGLSAAQPFCDGSHKGGQYTPLVFTAEKSEKKFLCACKQTANAPLCDGSHKNI